MKSRLWKKVSCLILAIAMLVTMAPMAVMAEENLQEQTVQVATSVYTKYYGDAPFQLDAVTDGDGTLVYVSDNPQVCTVAEDGTVTITGVGNAMIDVYATATENYAEADAQPVYVNVSLKGTTVKKFKAGKVARMTVTWARNEKASGYEVQFSYDKLFENVLTKKIKKNTTTKYTVKDIVGGQKVYVRVRCYKKINGETYYSDWSKAVKAKSKLAKKSALVPVAKLKNLKSLTHSCTKAELTKAYKAVRRDMRALVGISKKKQLMYIASMVRYYVDSGLVEYSMSAPHYADAYGYFVKGVGSCAGCARATGLCLNMLGYGYEHVNENMYTHQWCRVKVGKQYWICDAYGLYVGKEPAPRKHPYIAT